MSDPRIKQQKLKNILDECEHGHLRRKCPYCELIELEAENQRMYEALKEISSGMGKDLLGTTSLSQEDMQEIAKTALKAAEEEEK